MIATRSAGSALPRSRWRVSRVRAVGDRAVLMVLGCRRSGPLTRATSQPIRTGHSWHGALPSRLTLDRSSGVPLARQLADGVRDQVVAGTLAVGGRLPSTRALAGDLGVSRSVTEQAFDQLTAEGWLESRHGSGTYVAAGAAPRPRHRAVAAATRHIGTGPARHRHAVDRPPAPLGLAPGLA